MESTINSELVEHMTGGLGSRIETTVGCFLWKPIALLLVDPKVETLTLGSP